MFKNSAANQLMKFAENRGTEINTLDRLLQAQMGLPVPPQLSQASAQMGTPQQPPQLMQAAPIQPAQFDRPWLDHAAQQAPQQPPQPTMTPIVDPNAPQQPPEPWMQAIPPEYDPNTPQQPPQPSMQPGVDPGYAPQQPPMPGMQPYVDDTPPQQPQAPMEQGGSLNYGSATAPRPDWYNYRRSGKGPKLSYAQQVEETARAMGAHPLDLATVISYETGGTFDPAQPGPTTQWGQHKGPIQFGDAQAREYGVDWRDPIGSQFGADGAIARYFKDRGYKPGMNFYDLYSTVNAGRPGLYDRSDANNGGAAGNVADKVNSRQMLDHRRKAADMMGYEFDAEGGGDAPMGATAQAGQFDRGPSVGIPQPQAPLSEADYDRRIASLEEMANQTTPQRMTNREQFSPGNFDLGGALRGFGLGFGQMSHGQPVDLGSVYNSQERRANTELELALDSNRRSAASQMALEMGDENAAAAIAQGGIDFSQFLSQRQMEQVEARAMRAEMRDEIGRTAIFDYLAPQLGEEGARAAMYNPSTVLGFEQIMEANRRAEQARQEETAKFQTQLDLAQQTMTNPDATPTEQRAAEYVLQSQGSVTFKDAMSISGDDYDRFNPAAPEPTTSMRDFEASQANPQYGEWLDRNRGGEDTSAKEAQIARMMEADPDLSRSEAINAVDRHVLDPSSGRLVDRVSGTSVNSGAFEPAMGSDPTTTLYEQADMATGVGAAASRVAVNTVGQIPIIGSALIDDNSPHIIAGREFEAAKEDLGRALAMNPRFPVGEMDRIINTMGLNYGPFISPQALRASMKATDLYMRGRLERELEVASSNTATEDERAAARSAAQGLSVFIEKMGVPQSDNAPAQLPADEELAAEVYNSLSVGDYYISPEGDLRQKGG